MDRNRIVFRIVVAQSRLIICSNREVGVGKINTVVVRGHRFRSKSPAGSLFPVRKSRVFDSSHIIQ